MRLYPVRFFVYDSPAIRGKVLCAYMAVLHDGLAYQFFRERVIPHTWLRSAYDVMDLVLTTEKIVKREIRRMALNDLLFPEQDKPKQAPPVRE